MNNFSDKLKDYLYNSVDYLIMLLIIVSVVGIIGWRLDILFGDTISIAAKRDIEVVNDYKPKDEDSSNHETPKAQTPETSEDPIEQKPVDPEIPKEPTDQKPDKNTENIKIVIPAGTLPGKIALILYENGVIDSNKNFINKVVALKADTKLKSGTFTIIKGSSYEEIINILTK